MRSNLKTILLPTLVFCLAAAPASAVFDELSLSPRSRAMGGAVTALPGDAWSWYHNPAALGNLDGSYLGSSTTQPAGADFNRLSALGISSPVGSAGGLALGLRHYGVEYKGTRLSREQSIAIGHGFRLFEDATSSAFFGWSLNAYNLDFAESVDGIDPGNAWTWGLDVGAMATVYERTRVGFMARNLNAPTIGVDQEELLQGISAGLAYEPYPGVITSFDLRAASGREVRLHGGMEFAITEILVLRAGLESEPNKLTGGFGIHLPGRLRFNYGFNTGGGVLDSTHQFGLSAALGRLGGE